MLLVSRSKSPDSPLRTAWHFIRFSPTSQRKSCWKCAISIKKLACPVTEYQVPTVTSGAAPEAGEGLWGCCRTFTASVGLCWVQLLIPIFGGVAFSFFSLWGKLSLFASHWVLLVYSLLLFTYCSSCSRGKFCIRMKGNLKMSC